jgi:hypothetical protein
MTKRRRLFPTKVVEVAWDNRFIHAKREARNSQLDYWILDTSVPKILGPFDEATFLKKRSELSIPDKLVLKDVYSFRP